MEVASKRSGGWTLAATAAARQQAQQEAPGNCQAYRPWLAAYEPDVPATISYPDQPLYRFLDRASAIYPRRAALVFFNRCITYRVLASLVNRFANALLSLDVCKGDRIAIHLPNAPQFVVAYYGALRVGAVVCPLSPLYTDSELQYQLNDCGAETIVTLTSTYQRIKTIQANTALRKVIVSNIKSYFPWTRQMLFTLFREAQEGHRRAVAAADLRLQHLLRDSPDEPPEVEVQADDLALLQYTGGTTGLPKAAMLSHRNLVTNVMQCVSWNSVAAEEGKEVFLAVLPFFHLYAQQVAMNQAIALGGTLVLFPRFERRSFLRAIDRYRPTIFPAVTTLCVKLLEDCDLSKHDLRSIKLCLCGAMALPGAVQEKFENATGGRLIEGYGMTEAGPLTHANPIQGKRKAGSIGVPISDTDARIVSTEDDRMALPVGQVGEICVRGPQLMLGYWNRPEETQKVMRDGWLHTGDLGRMDEDGFFYLVDRMKEMIVSGGFKVFPREVEELLYAHPKIKEAAVVGIQDVEHGEAPKAIVVPQEDQTLTENEVIAYCRAQLASYKVPTQVEFRTELPKSQIGKILKRKLLAE